MIGIFDSGSGGLSVFKEAARLLPEEKYVYFADNANCPYGDKSPEFIQERSREIARFLSDRGARTIIVACNTATAAAINTLRNDPLFTFRDRKPSGIGIVGMEPTVKPLLSGKTVRRSSERVEFIGMEPAVKPAALSSVSGVIGVLATAGTLSGSKYLGTKGRFEDEVRIVERVGKGFVELVESGILEGPVAEETVRASLGPLLDAGADRIVLGCTHYPFLSNVIRRIAGKDVQVIDPAPAVARHLVDVMTVQGLLSESEALLAEKRAGRRLTALPELELHTSGDRTSAERLLKLLTE